MRLRFTYRDFLLLLGIVVAMLIAITTLFYRDALVSVHPSVTKKSQTISRPAVSILKKLPTLLSKY